MHLKMSYVCPDKMLFLFNPLPENKILDWSKLKHYEQFLLFPQCFQKACFLQASKGVIVWEWVKLQELQSRFVI